jgi:molybdopterin synthase sulfur carrier subunit
MRVRLRIRYFAGAAAAAGTTGEDVQLLGGCDVTALVAALATAHGPGLARVLQAATFLVDEVSASRDQVLTDGQSVDVLPPFAGG